MDWKTEPEVAAAVIIIGLACAAFSVYVLVGLGVL